MRPTDVPTPEALKCSSPTADAADLVAIGDRAIAASPLRPGGAILVHGRRRSARSTGLMIEAGAELVIVGGDNAGFLVELASSTAATELAGRGTRVHSSFGSAVRAEAEQAEERRKVFHRRRGRWVRQRGRLAGFACGAVAATLCWIWPTVAWPEQTGSAFLLVLSLLLGFAAAGQGLATELENRFGETDANLRGLTLPTTFLTLLGIAAGGAWGVPRFGILSGIGLALFVGIALGCPIPLLMLFGAAGSEEGFESTSADFIGSDSTGSSSAASGEAP